MADDEDGKEYRWESGYEKTWEAIKEDDDGLLESNVADIIARAKRKRAALRASGAIKLGMMRHLFVIIDSSECMSLQDLKPTRYLCVLKLLEIFIDEFFDLNPISQLALLATKSKRCDRVTELSGNKKKHLEALKQLGNTPSCEGEPSLQNSLEFALKTLKNMPSHTSREILVLFGSLTTCDPTDIGYTIKALKDNNVRVSVIGLAAEVWVCRKLAKETGGDYNVLLDDHHLKELMLNLVEPPPAAGAMEASLIKMGFPGGPATVNSGVSIDGTSENIPAYCSCHMDSDVPLSTNTFSCPQCGSHYCELPVECKQCGLTLVSASHIARSYHHLFPIKPFIEKELTSRMNVNQCFACLKPFDDTDKNVYQCENCQCVVCLDCDIFIRETLHTCPGCASIHHTTNG
uniref:General transcription factor IIH subunit n=1 Tax=Moina brachiata TaxID=675436 RepID=A0A4Y7NJE0_9CRUS|nr:EOG090X05VA [Moina brachiata]SVE93003.1 EOG090X05VA [Moina brachiata]